MSQFNDTKKKILEELKKQDGPSSCQQRMLTGLVKFLSKSGECPPNVDRAPCEHNMAYPYVCEACWTLYAYETFGKE